MDKAAIAEQAARLRDSLRDEFGLDHDMALVYACVRDEIESRISERVKALICNYTTTELAMFQDACQRLGNDLVSHAIAE